MSNKTITVGQSYIATVSGSSVPPPGAVTAVQTNPNVAMVTDNHDNTFRIVGIGAGLTNISYRCAGYVDSMESLTVNAVVLLQLTVTDGPVT